MGDNRQVSCDSRSWGPIKGSSIIGKVVFLFWHNGHPDVHFFRLRLLILVQRAGVPAWRSPAAGPSV